MVYVGSWGPVVRRSRRQFASAHVSRTRRCVTDPRTAAFWASISEDTQGDPTVDTAAMSRRACYTARYRSSGWTSDGRPVRPRRQWGHGLGDPSTPTCTSRAGSLTPLSATRSRGTHGIAVGTSPTPRDVRTVFDDTDCRTRHAFTRLRGGRETRSQDIRRCKCVAWIGTRRSGMSATIRAPTAELLAQNSHLAGGLHRPRQTELQRCSLVGARPERASERR